MELPLYKSFLLIGFQFSYFGGEVQSIEFFGRNRAGPIPPMGTATVHFFSTLRLT
jgi:hypothetical protein